MLKNPIPGVSRRFTGTMLVLGLTSFTGYIAWAGQATAGKGERILVDLKVTVSTPATNEVQALATRYLVHSGEEIGYVLEGEIELTVDGHKYRAKMGDSFHFRSELPHGYRNVGPTPARILWINTPPTF